MLRCASLFSRSAWRRLCFVALVSYASLSTQGAVEDDWVVSLKAGFVLNFAKFTSWPEEALPRDSRLRIGVLGSENEVALIEQQLSGKTVRGHTLVVEALAEDSVTGFHIVYVTASAKSEHLMRLAQAPGYGVLWIGDAPNFAHRPPGVIAFFERDGKIRFRLNLEQAKRQGLQMSSKLASLAERVGS